MDRFAFIIHPLDPKKDVKRKFPRLGSLLPTPLIHFFSTFFPPVYISEITGITSQATGKKIKGWLIACPLTAKRMIKLPTRVSIWKIIQSARYAEQLGADIVGLGAFTSVVGDGGLTVADQLDIPVTTGNSLTIATAIEALYKGARMMDIEVSKSTAAVVGATGSIGKACTQMMAQDVRALYLIGRNPAALKSLQKEVQADSSAQILISTELDDLQRAELVVTVTSALTQIIHPEHLRSGSVICDVARPRDVSKSLQDTRDDVLVIDGGIIDIPGPADFHFDFGFPPGKAYACMAETIALALEGRSENFSLGKEHSLAKIQEISHLAHKHGLKLSGFRSFEKPITEEKIKNIRKNRKTH